MTERIVDIEKSSRHQKIIGNLGEHLVCNWLSRSGFEVAVVDHTGIDLIAYDPRSKTRLGITVRSRTRGPGKERDPVNLFDPDDRQKIREACESFACEPWIAVYVETTEYADLYFTSLQNYDSRYRSVGTIGDDWKMSQKYIKSYDEDANLMHLHMKFEVRNWFRK